MTFSIQENRTSLHRTRAIRRAAKSRTRRTRPNKTRFNEKVYALTRRIPRGKVATYAAIAAALGRPGAARAVGNALNKNPDMRLTPCHRIVRSDGSVGGYASGTNKKIARLRGEGIII